MWLLTVNETPVFPLFLSLQYKLIYCKKLPALTIKLQEKPDSKPLNNVDTRNQLQKTNIRKKLFTHFHFLGYDLYAYCYPYLKTIFGIFSSKQNFKKKITRQGSNWLLDADSFWIIPWLVK